MEKCQKCGWAHTNECVPGFRPDKSTTGGEHLELTHIWKDQSGNVVAKLYGGVSLIPEIAKRQARIEELEASETALINERDNYHDWADRLANAIAAHVGEEIGEHTSANSPWANALELIDAETEELPANSDL